MSTGSWVAVWGGVWVAVFVPMFTRHHGEKAGADTTVVEFRPAAREVVLKVEGMACEGCAKDVTDALTEVPAQLLAKDGPDGAELAIDDAVDLAHAATRYTTLVIVSGDHYFTRLAQDARRHGMRVHQVASRRSHCSRALRRAAHTCSELDTNRLIEDHHARSCHRRPVSLNTSAHRPTARPTTPQIKEVTR